MPKVMHLPPFISQQQSQQLKPGSEQRLFASPGLWQNPWEVTWPLSCPERVGASPGSLGQGSRAGRPLTSIWLLSQPSCWS